MTPQLGRTQECNRAQAVVRLDQARAFLEVAELVIGEDDELANDNVVAALAVLAGIAACDAACCGTLGRRSRGQDHRQAIQLVARLGLMAMRCRRRFVGCSTSRTTRTMVYVGPRQAKSAVRNARALVDGAELLT